MVKEPHPGRVKTRLGAGIGLTNSAWWFRHQCARLLRRIESPRWQVILAVSPDREGLNSRVWPQHFPRISQGNGDLGRRMAGIFAMQGPGPIVVIGADIPDIQQHHIAAAFKALGDKDAVFGPASDGGYWLVGLKRTRKPPTCLFNDVRWSTDHALSDTLRTIPGLTFSLITTLDDVDNAADLARHPA